MFFSPRNLEFVLAGEGALKLFVSLHFTGKLSFFSLATETEAEEKR